MLPSPARSVVWSPIASTWQAWRGTGACWSTTTAICFLAAIFDLHFSASCSHSDPKAGLMDEAIASQLNPVAAASTEIEEI